MFDYSLLKEFLTQDKIKQMQTKMLRKHLAYCMQKSVFYKKINQGGHRDD